jgi:hypothetical protein
MNKDRNFIAFFKLKCYLKCTIFIIKKFNMKNNPFVLVVAIVLGLSMGAYVSSSRLAYIFFNILRDIR